VFPYPHQNFRSLLFGCSLGGQLLLLENYRKGYIQAILAIFKGWKRGAAQIRTEARKLDMGQQSEILKQFNGRGPVPDSIDWNLAGDASHIPHAAEPLYYTLVAKGMAGDSILAVDSLGVEQTTLRQKRIERVADKEIDKYTLLLFNFGSTNLDEANRRRIEYIKQQLTPGTTIDITGHTDRTAEAAPNLKISELRAQTAAELLGKTASQNVEGLGKSVLLYNNDLPEGRFYSRTVDITLEKPIAKQ